MTYDPAEDPRYIIDLRGAGWIEQIVKMRGMETLLDEMIYLVAMTDPPATYLITLQANLQYALSIYNGRHAMEDEIMGMVQTCVKEIRKQEDEGKTRGSRLTDTWEID